MPNHIHGIVFLNKKLLKNNQDEPELFETPPDEAIVKQSGGFAGDKNPMLSDNLSKAIRCYKGRVTFEARKLDKQFSWQSLFYDTIIRSEQSFQNITAYISNNPKNWSSDKLYSE